MLNFNLQRYKFNSYYHVNPMKFHDKNQKNANLLMYLKQIVAPFPDTFNVGSLPKDKVFYSRFVNNCRKITNFATLLKQTNR